MSVDPENDRQRAHVTEGRWAIYCERLGGWLVDTSFVWSWDVTQCAEFSSPEAVNEAIEGMIGNGHDPYDGPMPAPSAVVAMHAPFWDATMIRVR